MRGIASWIAPPHTEANPITGYQTNIDFNDAGVIKPYAFLNCVADIQNARCQLLGTIKLPEGEKYDCTRANENFLNKLFTISVQAISNGASIGEKMSSPIAICDPAFIEKVSDLSPTPLVSPDVVASSNTQRNNSQTVDKSPTPKETNSTTDSLKMTNPPDIPESDSRIERSSPTLTKTGKSFFDLGSDLDEPTRKKAQLVVISYLAIAFSVTNRNREG